jgi:hypothetical protein
MVTAFKSYIELHWLSWVFLGIIGAIGWLVATLVAKPLIQFWDDRRSALQVLRTHGLLGWGSEESFRNAVATVRQASAQMMFYAEGGPLIVRLYSKIRGYNLRLAGQCLNGLTGRMGENSTADGVSLQSDGVRVCLGATQGMKYSRLAEIRQLLSGDATERHDIEGPK